MLVEADSPVQTPQRRAAEGSTSAPNAGAKPVAYRAPQQASGAATPGGKGESRFEAQIKAFLAYCRVECGFAPATIQAYTRDLADLWGWMVSESTSGWEDLTHARIVAHLQWLEKERHLAESSVARHLATVRVFARFLASTGYLEDNPAELLQQPKQWQRLPKVMGPEEVKRLLEAPQPGDHLYQRDKAIIELLYAGGLRASEIADLTMDQVHVALGVVRVFGKGSKERMVPIGKPALEAIQVYCETLRPKLMREDKPVGQLFLSRTGSPIQPHRHLANRRSPSEESRTQPYPPARFAP